MITSDWEVVSDIRAAHFVMDERRRTTTTPADLSCGRIGRTPYWLLPKNAADILYVTDGDLASNRGRIIRLYTIAGSVSCTVMQYSVTFCHLLQVAIDVISGMALVNVSIYINKKYGCSKSNCF